MNTMDIELRKITDEIFEGYEADPIPAKASKSEPNPFSIVIAVIGMILLACIVIAGLISLGVDMSNGNLTGTAQDTGWGYGL